MSLLRRAAALAFALACAASQAGQADGADAPAEAVHGHVDGPLPAGVFAQIGVAREAVADTCGATWNVRSDGLRAGWTV